MTNHQTMLKIFILEDNADFLNFLKVHFAIIL